MDFKIEKNVPLRSPRKVYPWGKMAVGDSFFVPEVKVTSVTSSATLAGARMGMKFTCRSVDGGVRIWRIE